MHVFRQAGRRLGGWRCRLQLTSRWRSSSRTPSQPACQVGRLRHWPVASSSSRRCSGHRQLLVPLLHLSVAQSLSIPIPDLAIPGATAAAGGPVLLLHGPKAQLICYVIYSLCPSSIALVGIEQHRCRFAGPIIEALQSRLHILAAEGVRLSPSRAEKLHAVYKGVVPAATYEAMVQELSSGRQMAMPNVSPGSSTAANVRLRGVGHTSTKPMHGCGGDSQRRA